MLIVIEDVHSSQDPVEKQLPLPSTEKQRLAFLLKDKSPWHACCKIITSPTKSVPHDFIPLAAGLLSQQNFSQNCYFF